MHFSAQGACLNNSDAGNALLSILFNTISVKHDPPSISRSNGALTFSIICTPYWHCCVNASYQLYHYSSLVCNVNVAMKYSRWVQPSNVTDKRSGLLSWQQSLTHNNRTACHWKTFKTGFFGPKIRANYSELSDRIIQDFSELTFKTGLLHSLIRCKMNLIIMFTSTTNEEHEQQMR